MEEFNVVRSPFNLQTYQRRLRHLQSIAVRNLHCPKSQEVDLSNLQVYFTLHKDNRSKAFYTSEKITGSLNPTWQNFDLKAGLSDVDLTTKFFIVRVWFGTAVKQRVKLECHVALSGLVFFADKLQVPGLKHGPNTVLFGMFNVFFIHLDTAASGSALTKWVPDQSVPKDSTPAAVMVEQWNIRRSYNTSYLARIHTVQRAIRQTHASVKRIHSSIEDRLLSSQEKSQGLSKREALLMRVGQLRQELVWQTQQKQTDQEELEAYQTELEARQQALKERKEKLQQLMSEMEENRGMHIQSREMLVKENAQVLFRRKQIINEMVHYIYPITEDEKHSFYICNVRLPDAENYQGQEEQMVSVSLGFTCHLVSMVSRFMDMPLRYPMVHRGSRSTITDHILSKLTEKDRDFPLYGKGKEKFQFNYAVFLLNKNISQLRFYCGLGTNDLRLTLPNIKSLLENRLGVRSTSAPSERGSMSVKSPLPASVGQASGDVLSVSSNKSLAASGSTSSFVRRDLALSELDPADISSRPSSFKSAACNSSRPDSLEANSGLAVPVLEQSTNPLGLPRAEAQEGMGHTGQVNHQGNSHHKAAPTSELRGKVNDPNSNNVPNSGRANGNHSSDVDDESEDIFKPSGDQFFHMTGPPAVQVFSSSISPSGIDPTALLDAGCFIDGSLFPMSDLLHSPTHRSFKLVKSAVDSPNADAFKDGKESPSSDGERS